MFNLIRMCRLFEIRMCRLFEIKKKLTIEIVIYIRVYEMSTEKS